MSVSRTTWTIVILAVSVSLVLADSNVSCLTWFFYSNATRQCECVEIDGLVSCNRELEAAMIASGVCVTLAPYQESVYLAGECPLRYVENNTNRMWSELPSDPDKLNKNMCGPYNREGVLCGRCIEGYGVPIYSTDLKCVNCSVLSHRLSTFLYLLIEFVPITLFFVCIILFRVNITSGPLLGYVLFCQLCYEETIGVNQHVFEYIKAHSSKQLKLLFFSSQTLSELWNLVFFKSLIPPFCVSEHLNRIHLQVLTLVPATYSVILLITLCIIVELQARNCRLFRFLGKPFHYLGRFNIGTISGYSIIQAFATCLLLSTTTLGYNMAALSLTTIVHDPVGEIIQVVYYIDPDVLYLSQIAVPLTLVTLPCVVLVLIPASLLCIYPTRIYRRFTRCISARKQLAITAFVEALNSCFKNGLNGTRDYRAIAGLIMLILPFLTTWTGNIGSYSWLCFSGSVLLILSLVVSYLRPCKSTLANLSLSYHSMMAGILKFGLHLWEKDLSTGTTALELALIMIPFISHILVLFWMAYIAFQYMRMHFELLNTMWVKLTKFCFWRRNANDYQVLSDC